MAKQIVLGLVQMRCKDDVEANLSNALEKINSAVSKGAQIICLPELFRSFYFPQSEDIEQFSLAESIPGETTEKLSKVAKAKKIVIIAPIFEKRASGVYHNSVVIIDGDGKIVGKYRKMHIPDDPCFYEKFYFAPGDLGFQNFNTKYGKIGLLICWDQWFPEAARLTALQGAQIIFYPTAIGWHDSEKKSVAEAQLQAWETVQRGHAIANGVFVAAVNRVGREGSLTFWGSSFVSSPFGEVLARANRNEEEVLIVKCDLDKIDQIRQSWPFLRDRRIDAYSAITSRFVDSQK
ncbi:MAG: carbon-nitrogen hydrolase [Thaumarchaeota archaeon]|nr:carbon-nitrogen hydrolase [Nitrososphaerota archaeon]